MRYGHLVHDRNRQPRVDWCNARISEDCTFRRYVFTDESMIQLDPNSRKVWILSTAKERRIKSMKKFPAKVNRFILLNHSYKLRYLSGEGSRGKVSPTSLFFTSRAESTQSSTAKFFETDTCTGRGWEIV